MKKQTRLLFLLLLSVSCVLSISSGAVAQNGGAGAPKPPMAEKKTKTTNIHGETLVDDFFWLREGPTAMLSVIVVQVFKNVGLNMVLFLAALQGVPRELQEAARVDGANDRQIFGRIVLPLISPTILLTLIITIVGSLQVYAQIAVLTQGGPGISTTVLVYYLVQQAFDFHHFGYGSTLALLLFLIVLVLTIAQWQLRKRWVFYEN